MDLHTPLQVYKTEKKNIMKKDTTQPPTEKPIEKVQEAVEAGILPGKKEHLMQQAKNQVTIIVFDDEYVTLTMWPATKKALKVGDRVKNAIRAMLKEGYAVTIENLNQPELPF